MKVIASLILKKLTHTSRWLCSGFAPGWDARRFRKWILVTACIVFRGHKLSAVQITLYLHSDYTDSHLCSCKSSLGSSNSWLTPSHTGKDRFPLRRSGWNLSIFPCYSLIWYSRYQGLWKTKYNQCHSATDCNSTCFPLNKQTKTKSRAIWCSFLIVSSKNSFSCWKAA